MALPDPFRRFVLAVQQSGKAQILNGKSIRLLGKSNHATPLKNSDTGQSERMQTCFAIVQASGPGIIDFPGRVGMRQIVAVAMFCSDSL
jgi:hypothetical protein